MDIKQYIQKAYETSCKHGFHDEEKPMEHWLMLVITEVTEAVEADRKQKHAKVAEFKTSMREVDNDADKYPSYFKTCFEDTIKNTVGDEFADVCIRLFDLAGTFNYELEAIDEQLISKHYFAGFWQLPFSQIAYKLCQLLTEKNADILTVQLALAFMQMWAKHEGINLQWHIEQKMRFNTLRPRMHGKQY